jgi:hypothetical protein
MLTRTRSATLDLRVEPQVVAAGQPAIHLAAMLRLLLVSQARIVTAAWLRLSNAGIHPVAGAKSCCIATNAG